MHTLLEATLTLNENNPARHALLAHLNTAYNMLDLRAGWQGKRFADSAQAAYEYLLKEYPAINRWSTVGGRFISAPDRPPITVTRHAHLSVWWMSAYC